MFGRWPSRFRQGVSLWRLKLGDFGLLTEPDRESVEMLISILTPCLSFAIPKTVAEYIENPTDIPTRLRVVEASGDGRPGR